MPTTENLEKAPRKELHVFYVLDTSGSMTGAKIGALNHAMEESTIALKDVARKNGDADLRIAVLEFNSGCKWVTSNGPEAMDDFEYEHLSCGGLTDIGAALKELNSKLSRKSWLNSMVGALMPVIIFMTDGFATDDYKGALEEIKHNKWFTKGIRIGFAVGEEADADMIAEIVGNREAVIKTTDLELFSRLLKFVTVSASTLASSSQTTRSAFTGEDIVRDAKKTSGMETGNNNGPDFPGDTGGNNGGDDDDDDDDDDDGFPEDDDDDDEEGW